jgi:hypothetical protein
VVAGNNDIAINGLAVLALCFHFGRSFPKKSSAQKPSGAIAENCRAYAFQRRGAAFPFLGI